MTACTVDMVHRLVRAERRAGSKREVAYGDVGALLGISPRWVRSVARGEPIAVQPSRAARIRAGFREWQIRRIAELDREAAEIRASLEADYADLAVDRGGDTRVVAADEEGVA